MLYPQILPYKTEMLKVSNIHTIYIEQCGNPLGKPVVFLHGGPGGGLLEKYRQFFNPEKYRIILFDQRGCGKSLPFAEINENTTWDLVSDMEKIRHHLSIDRWSVFGGSWGSTLALTYAVTHPKHVLDLFLRGIFLLRKKEIDWFYQEGCSKIFPDFWEKYLEPIPLNERSNMVEAYYKRLTSTDLEVRKKAAVAWSTWEGLTSKLIVDPDALERFSADDFAEAFARIECHYFINKGFFKEDHFLLNEAYKLENIRTVIVQGRYDVVCPAESAWDLKKAVPHAHLHLIPDAGHSISETSIARKLVEYTDLWAD